jgi:hypothetical protein
MQLPILKTKEKNNNHIVAEKTFTHVFLCNSVANATLNCIENEIQ